MRVLVTGGCGFIGSALVRLLLDEGVEVANLDLLTYAGLRANLREVEGHPAYRFHHGDVCDPEAVDRALEGAELVLHLAAESHVDRSIEDDAAFVRTNVEGTRVILERSRAQGVRVVLASTDEVYGGLPVPDAGGAQPGPGGFAPDAPLRPSSPYAASKAAGDLLALACHRTHGQDVVVVRATNTYGPRQYPEKLIPVAVTAALEGRPVPVYGDGRQRRNWLHVEDHARGLRAAAARGEAGAVYHLAGDDELPNLEVVRTLLQAVGAPPDAVRFVRDRPGHDRRYALETGESRRRLGWEPRIPFPDGVAGTVRWYREHRAWWETLPDRARRRG